MRQINSFHCLLLVVLPVLSIHYSLQIQFDQTQTSPSSIKSKDQSMENYIQYIYFQNQVSCPTIKIIRTFLLKCWYFVAFPCIKRNRKCSKAFMDNVASSDWNLHRGQNYYCLSFSIYYQMTLMDIFHIMYQNLSETKQRNRPNDRFLTLLIWVSLPTMKVHHPKITVINMQTCF